MDLQYTVQQLTAECMIYLLLNPHSSFGTDQWPSRSMQGQIHIDTVYTYSRLTVRACQNELVVSERSADFYFSNASACDIDGMIAICQYKFLFYSNK